MFGYKNQAAVDRAYGLIRKWTATNASAHDTARLEDVLDRSHTAIDVCADTAYRSAMNEAMLARHGFVSRSYNKKPMGRPMPEPVRILNAASQRSTALANFFQSVNKYVKSILPLRAYLKYLLARFF